MQELVATGHITDDEARTHPRRNIVTRALGIDPTVRVDAWTLPLVRGDRFLLCSDGLVDEVRDDDIVEVVKTVTDPQAAADELVALANRQGGRDNVTVVVVDVVEGADPPDPDTELDLEPAWDDGTTESTWAVDDPDAEATEFADLAALVSGDDPQAAEAATADPAATTTTDEIPVDASRRARQKKRRVAGFLAGLGVLAVLVLAFVIASAWGRWGLLRRLRRRRRGRHLPRPERRLPLVRPDRGGADRVQPRRSSTTTRSCASSDEPSFDSDAPPSDFVAEQLQATTTTSTTTTTTDHHHDDHGPVDHDDRRAVRRPFDDHPHRRAPVARPSCRSS